MMPAADSAINWAGPLTLEWRLRAMDETMWQPGEIVRGATSATVSRDASGSLVESGSVEVQDIVSSQPRDFYGRFELVARQGAIVERWPVATLLLVPGDATIQRGRKTIPYDGYSALKQAQDTVLPTGYSVRAGDDGAAAAVEILQAAMPAPVRAEGSFTLSQPIVLSRGTSRLDAAWMLVNAAGWCIQPQPDGSIVVKAKPQEASLSINAETAGMLSTTVSAGDGAVNVPNTYIAVDGLLTATATIGDGRPVEVYDDAPKRVNGETLQAYAERRLAELNEVVGTRGYQRAWFPGITVFDAVEGNLPEAGLDCMMRITSQHFTLGGELMVDEGTEVLR